MHQARTRIHAHAYTCSHKSCSFIHLKKYSFTMINIKMFKKSPFVHVTAVHVQKVLLLETPFAVYSEIILLFEECIKFSISVKQVNIQTQ